MGEARSYPSTQTDKPVFDADDKRQMEREPRVRCRGPPPPRKLAPGLMKRIFPLGNTRVQDPTHQGDSRPSVPSAHSAPPHRLRRCTSNNTSAADGSLVVTRVSSTGAGDGRPASLVPLANYHLGFGSRSAICVRLLSCRACRARRARKARRREGTPTQPSWWV